MKTTILIVVALLCVPMWAQENTFRLTVLGYQWTTTHRTLTFSWPGYSNTSCNGSVNVNGNVSGGNIYASGTTFDTCSTTYTPPSNQNIDIQKPVVFILADTENSRMVLTCTRNVRWSQCHALNPGPFLARNDHGRFEVQGLSGKGKEEWVKFDIVQQTAISQPPAQEAAASIQAPASIEAPKSEGASGSSGFPTRWKSMTTGTMTTGTIRTYVGKINGRIVSTDGGKSCSGTWPIELTLVTSDRIEGRSFTPPTGAKTDWNACTFSPPADWHTFTWIPVK
jgi:hypothetical protein